jgi:hypothetical protein
VPKPPLPPHGRACQALEAAEQELDAPTELLRMFVTAGRTAARSMRTSLTAAAPTQPGMLCQRTWPW